MSSAATLPTPQQGHNDHRPDDRHDDDAESGAVAASDVRSAPPTTIHRRQGDRRGSDDDAAAAPRLPTFVRFRDLFAANIVHNWPTLLRLMDEEGFPCGVLLGRNTRAWPLEDVEAWLATRPTARKTAGSNQKELETTA
jgi:hypothetical protein